MLLSDLKEFQEILNRAATSSTTDEDIVKFPELRFQLLRDIELNSILPDFVKSTRDIKGFWDFISPKSPTYSGRRLFICQQLEPLFQKLEEPLIFPSDSVISSTLSCHINEHIIAEWKKALDRRKNDPEGAITSARSLLETVCKHILDNERIVYTEKVDLPELYKLVSAELNLSPGNHCVDIFKQILGGCNSVVLGLGSLRNKLSDSHGKPLLHVKPSLRHAEFAVNLAGTVASFLIQTHEHHLLKKSIEINESIGQPSSLEMFSE